MGARIGDHSCDAADALEKLNTPLNAAVEVAATDEGLGPAANGRETAVWY